MKHPSKLLRRIVHCFDKIRLQPIRVFCFHHVSEEYDPLLCGIEDWIQTDELKSKLKKIQKQYRFISIDEAYNHIKYDLFRTKRYAVLTSDDGLRSAWEMIPWMVEHDIPLTMFINAKYLEGKSYKELDAVRIKKIDKKADVESVIKRQYITKEELWSVRSSLVSVALHGYEHLDATKISTEDFQSNVEKCVNELQCHPLYRPYYAYTWGRHNPRTDELLLNRGLIPVLVDGMANYSDVKYIHRELIK